MSWGTPVGICIVVLVTAATRVTADDVASDRQNRLSQCADDMPNVKIDKVQKNKPQAKDGRVSGSSSELHIRFQPSVANTSDSTQTAVMLIPVHCAGYTSTLGASSQRTSGSDVVTCEVTINNLLDPNTPHPKAQILVPKMDHGSPYDAETLVHDQIQLELAKFLPEVDIDGMQLFYEKQLNVTNNAPEPITVWVQYYTRDLTAKPAAWVWKPGQPLSSNALRTTIAAKASKLITTNPIKTSGIARIDLPGFPIQAVQVYIWAESKSGETWDDNRQTALWLVDPDPNSGNARQYHDKQIQTYTTTFSPSNKPQLFTERVLSLKNVTSEDLRVTLQYFNNSNGQFGWHVGTFSVPAGSSLAPQTDDGELIRASQLYLSAQSTNRRFTKYSNQPLWTVAESDGQRVYQGTKIGAFAYVFEANSADAGSTQQVRIVRDGAAVLSGSTQITTLSAGQQFPVLQQSGTWFLIQVNVNGQTQQGWVSQSDVQLLSS